MRFYVEKPCTFIITCAARAVKKIPNANKPVLSRSIYIPFAHNADNSKITAIEKYSKRPKFTSEYKQHVLQRNRQDMDYFSIQQGHTEQNNP